MRLLPVQIDMYMLAGDWMPFCEPDELPIVERVASARLALVKETGQDFGFDLRKWHDYLVEHFKDEYCWSNKHSSILVRIRAAEADPAWREAVAQAQIDEQLGPPTKNSTALEHPMSNSPNPFSPSDAARVVEEGPWLGKRGVIQEVDSDNGRIVLFFDHFGRIVPCELEYSSVEKLRPEDWDESLEQIRAYLFDDTRTSDGV